MVIMCIPITKTMHLRNIIFNQNLKLKPDIYITSLSKLMDESLKYFLKLSVDKIIKYWMFEHVKVVPQLSNVVKWNKDSE